MNELSAKARRAIERRYTLLFAVGCVFAALLPTLFGWLATPPGFQYVGHQTNVDDHMVYAAWMRQAAHGSFLFDNRFAVDPQPGLTFHLYFWLLGQIARFTGLTVAATIGRAGFSFLFVLLLAKLIHRLKFSVFGTKLSFGFVILAGGLGFLPMFWTRFGVAGPTDVWQPEGFVFPSMLTNGLFMVSLCLILSIFLAILRAQRKNRKFILVGALALAALVNIHSYDALLVALVLLGFLGAQLSRRQLTKGWVFRGLLIACGAILPALWFVYVLQHDPVFRERAATPTFSPNFRQVVLGYLPPVMLALFGILNRIQKGPLVKRRMAGLLLASGTLLALLGLAFGHQEGYFLTPLGWLAVFAAMLTSVYLLADKNPAWNLVVSWALIGTVAPYFPALFERKLTMGLAIPWALLAALGLQAALQNRERGARNLVTILGLLVLGGSAVRWFFREISFISDNVASTVRHPIYLSPDLVAILGLLDKQEGRHVLLALPGASVNRPGTTDDFIAPQIPDFSPFASGLAGTYTFAGHWSETPHYNERAGLSTKFILRNGMSPDQRKELIAQYGIDFVLLPDSETFQLDTVSPSELGETVYDGTQFDLVRIR